MVEKKFVAAALNLKHETFLVYVTSLNLVPGIHPDREDQITSLLTEENKIPDEYSDFANIFLEKKALVLPKHI